MGPRACWNDNVTDDSGSRIYGYLVQVVTAHWVIGEHQTLRRVTLFCRDRLSRVRRVCNFGIRAGSGSRDFQGVFQCAVCRALRRPARNGTDGSPYSDGLRMVGQISTGNSRRWKSSGLLTSIQTWNVDMDAVMKRCARHRRNRGGVL